MGLLQKNVEELFYIFKVDENIHLDIQITTAGALLFFFIKWKMIFLPNSLNN